MGIYAAGANEAGVGNEIADGRLHVGVSAAGQGAVVIQVDDIAVDIGKHVNARVLRGRVALKILQRRKRSGILRRKIVGDETIKRPALPHRQEHADFDVRERGLNFRGEIREIARETIRGGPHHVVAVPRGQVPAVDAVHDFALRGPFLILRPIAVAFADGPLPAAFVAGRRHEVQRPPRAGV